MEPLFPLIGVMVAVTLILRGVQFFLRVVG